ncbi:hypothetical protein [Magnetospirillum sp. 64-120]|uniref:hypothetical protein n=1 Tax=Magnetospirillum sp. 64-120 TaxID=1895778 RepID=UPI000928AA41|nr:hypothetical protein [Magnetospirillum sp. 64-120]OJX67191.1 MAG: hypothetical protein BGO92_16980 [Magnetospirillum sp. 64-120]
MIQFQQNDLQLDLASSSWPTEPPLAEILGDPTLRQLMDSDRVSMESLNDLLRSVRQKLAG